MVNLSSQDLPDVVYLYLARGLNFVEARSAKKEDLLYDTKEFLRKMEWKAYFNELQTGNDSFEEDIHRNLRIPSRKHPEGFSNPLFDDIKTKVLGFVSNFQPRDKKSNLTKAEIRGKDYLLKQINAKCLFVSKADKGGATIILDWDTAVESIRSEMNKPEKFVKLECTIEEKMIEVKNLIKETVCDKEAKGIITAKDRKIITGINEKGNMMHSHVFRATVPYAYPLYKIHKLSRVQINNKLIPPNRLVHSTKQGPLYRLEKWCSPYLTDISRFYCGDEFILDTPDLLAQIEDMNNCGGDNRPALLFTLDVVSLYPSIIPEIAFEALADACNGYHLLLSDTKEVVQEFTEFILSNSFVTFEDAVYVTKEGIPTGNCISRQIADCHMHFVVLKKIAPQMATMWKPIRFWRRFIDDILGKWYGTTRQFKLFVTKLNELAKPYGIQFGDQQIGKEVTFLDVKLYLDNDNTIQYRLHKKETDARLFLQPTSYHPEHVFSSVVFSQMIRVISRNSKTSTCQEDLKELKKDLIKSGHYESSINHLEPQAYARALENKAAETTEEEKKPSLVFSVKYFKEIKHLKKLVRNIEGDISDLCGEIRVVFAMRKHLSIGNTIVRNRKLSDGNNMDEKDTDSQKCHSSRCKSDPMLFEESEVMVNGKICKLNFSLNCKDKNLIYLTKCQICDEFKNAYFGQTVQSGNKRMNGHRDKFVIDDVNTFEKSALSIHCHENHPDKFDLKYFKLGFVKQVNPSNLDREEDVIIQEYKTNIWGLNRIKVKR